METCTEGGNLIGITVLASTVPCSIWGRNLPARDNEKLFNLVDERALYLIKLFNISDGWSRSPFSLWWCLMLLIFSRLDEVLLSRNGRLLPSFASRSQLKIRRKFYWGCPSPGVILIKDEDAMMKTDTYKYLPTLFPTFYCRVSVSWLLIK